MQPDACYTHRTDVTESHKIITLKIPLVKRDKEHHPGADKGECRNSSVET